MKFESGSFTHVKRATLLCSVFSTTLAFGQLISAHVPPHFTGPNPALTAASTPIPMWNYSVVASADRGGGTYTGTIVGRSPFSHGKTTTTIPTLIVPLVITINDGTTTHTYDPTALDPCVTPPPTTHTDVDVITGSPIFTPPAAPWIMNGVNVGPGQYIDAFQRAEFWSLVAGTPYHLVLSPTVLAPQTSTFTTGTSNHNGPCGKYGFVPLNDLDTYVRGLITGPLAGVVNTGTFPIFLTSNVFFSLGGGAAGGYHSALFVGAVPLIYSPFAIDTSGIFGGNDVTILSHEMGEAINDPVDNNGPTWGHIGQYQTVCQTFFEVGDPLTPGFGPSNTFVTPGANGLTYHMQELAYFNWFFGAPNLGTAGFYSNNGTFTGDAKLCPPGGTN